MTGEEMERAIQFILEQQAQVTATVGRLSETVDRLSEKVDRNADGVTALLAIAEIQAAEIKELGATVRAVSERQQESDAKMVAMADAHRETGERLNALINTVERYISERRNGQA